jgi:hypothetical protein
MKRLGSGLDLEFMAAKSGMFDPIGASGASGIPAPHQPIMSPPTIIFGR